MKFQALEKDLQDLRDKNVELAQHLQRWKAVASEREKENKTLRMHLFHQKRVRSSINSFVETVIKELSQQHYTLTSELTQTLINTIGFFEDLKKKILVSEDGHFSSNPRSSPTNNIQLVQPMVKGHSILKPVITLARAVIGSQLNHSLSLGTTPEPPVEDVPIVAPRPIAQLLESFVPLHRVDNEINRHSDQNINIRCRQRRHSYNGNSCLLDVNVDQNENLDEVEPNAPEQDQSRRELPIVLPITRLLESFVPLQRVDNRSVSDENINIRHSKARSNYHNDYLLDDTIDHIENEIEGGISVSEMNTTMIEQNVDFDGDDNFEESNSAETSHSRIKLPHIVEELETEDINESAVNSSEKSAQNSSFEQLDLVPLVLLHRNSDEESKPEKVNMNPRAGPSWQTDDSDDEYAIGGQGPKKTTKGSKKKKKRQRKLNEMTKIQNITSISNTKCDKENIHHGVDHFDSDSDSENSNYDVKLNEMVIKRRVIDSLKPVKVVVNKLKMPIEECPVLQGNRTSNTGSSCETTATEDSTTENVESNDSFPESYTKKNKAENSDAYSDNTLESGMRRSSDINYFTRDSDDPVLRPSSRTRRKGLKDYKEVPLNKKLRRT